MSNRTIAVIEDDSDLLASIGRYLKAKGLRTELFISAEDFLVHDRLDRVVCIVSDIRLPGISGIELMRELAAANRVIPVVLITANKGSEIFQRAQESGCAGYLLKPFTGDALFAEIAKASGKILDPGIGPH